MITMIAHNNILEIHTSIVIFHILFFAIEKHDVVLKSKHKTFFFFFAIYF